MAALGLAACAAGMALAPLRGTWTDEAATIFAVSKPLGEWWREILRHDVNPPGGYLILWLWERLGSSPAHLRALSAILFGVCTALTFWLGRRLRGARVGVFAAVLFAFAPLSLFMSAQARYPMLLTALLLSSSLALFELTKRGRSRDAVAWAVLAAAAAYVHYFAAFVLIAQLLFIVVSWRRLADRRKVVAALIALAVLYAPWLPVLVRQLVGREAAGGGEHIAFTNLAPLVLAYLTQGFSFWRLPSFWREAIAPSLPIVPLLTALPFVGLVGAGAIARSEDRLSRAFLLTLGLFPLAAFLAVSAALDLFAPHYFLPFLPFLSLLAADGAAWLWRRAKPAAALAGLLAVVIAGGGVVEFWQHPDEPEGWRPLARAIARAAQDGDAVLLPNLAARLCYTIEKRDALPVYHLTMTHRGQQVVTADMVDELLPLLKQRHRRIWYVEYYPARFDPQHAAERAALASGGWRSSTQLAADPRVALKLWYLRGPFEPGGLSSVIAFPDGPQHPFQMGAGWFAGGGAEAWIAPEADALLRLEPNAQLELTATVPVTLFGGQAPTVSVSVNGRPVETRVMPDGQVVLGDSPDPGDVSPVAIKIRCSRSFVPDELFHDGDQSRKCMLVQHLGWRRR
jgi:hypothetical protein